MKSVAPSLGRTIINLKPNIAGNNNNYLPLKKLDFVFRAARNPGISSNCCIFLRIFT